MNKKSFVDYIAKSEFQRLFILEMGWNNPKGQTYFDLIIEGETFHFNLEAERSGFQVLTCLVNEIPTPSFCKKIDTRLRRQANDYICIYHLRQYQHHLWVVPVKKVEKRDLVFVEYETAEKASFLFEKVDGLTFELGEHTTIVDVKARVQGAFIINSEKITKDFYKGFHNQHKSFVKFITGIDDQIDPEHNRNKQWYTSVMLNRLMFCYFIQKKGFLDNNVDYLRDKLNQVKQEEGEDQFYSFYKDFLLLLFHEGLNNPRHDQNFERKFGRVPYLNGGMFDIHELEAKYSDINIRDDAFENLFTFFDQWRWHLDDRLTATGKDINPDVLGYIFEQYINDRAQMGAYYTKEDITEYIGRNTIVPYLLESTRKADEKPFCADGSIWNFLRESGDQYIFDAVKKGHDIPLPNYIAEGIDTSQPNLLERRSRWNEQTGEEWALPTEIWRETIERLQRYKTILSKIEKGEITQVNDFITYNLDIRQFVLDFLSTTDNHLFVKHFYHALQKVTILDPTCGSGAFLFAALNILEPLYEMCITRMQDWQAQTPNLFKEELEELNFKYRSNIRYFIYKSIILRNLYGVDIMAEATEIAKLRLFLKMVAVVDVNSQDTNLGLEPLPDIDFNIRCGNTLVGYATDLELQRDLIGLDIFARQEFEDKLNDEMMKVSKAYEIFKYAQLGQELKLESYKKAKADLKKSLCLLNNLLNNFLHKAISPYSDYERWMKSHQPFHWLAEYYEIIKENGGFDIIIGNPPYVEYKNVKEKYQLDAGVYKTLDCGNLHAFIAERVFSIGVGNARIGLIVPLPSMNTLRMESLQRIIKPKQNNYVWISCFDERPSGLFNGVDQRLIIELISKCSNKALFTTGITRWLSENRGLLFNTIFYTYNTNKSIELTTSILKFKSSIEMSMIEKFYKDRAIINYKSMLKTNVKNSIYYRTAGGRYWKVFLDNSFGTNNASEKSADINSISKYAIISILSSDVFWWYYSLHFDMFNLKDYMIFSFRFNQQSNLEEQKLEKLGKKYINSLEYNAINKEIAAKHGIVTQKQYYVRKSKPIINEIDKVLAKHYGFTEEELDFIINYDIKYRMGDELNEE